MNLGICFATELFVTHLTFYPDMETIRMWNKSTLSCLHFLTDIASFRGQILFCFCTFHVFLVMTKIIVPPELFVVQLRHVYHMDIIHASFEMSFLIKLFVAHLTIKFFNLAMDK